MFDVYRCLMFTGVLCAGVLCLQVFDVYRCLMFAGV